MDQNIFPPPSHYSAYLLRFWNEPSTNPQAGLRMMLIDLRTGEQWGFADLEWLFDFIKKKACPDTHGVDNA